MPDQLVLLLAVAALYLPGALVLLAARTLSLAALLGVAPLLSLAVIALAAFAGQVLGVDYEIPLVVLVALAAAAAVVEVVRRRPAPTRPTRPQVAGVLVALVGVGLATRAWLRGVGGLTTPPQTHDPITHTMVTSFVARTGQAGPDAVQAMDLLSGEPVRYYPAGLHSFAALFTHITPDAVAALNAAVIVLCAVVGPLAVFAAASRLEVPATAPAFAGLAALFSAGMFRPAAELAHDAGILAFAVGLALLPGLLVAVLDVGGLRPAGPLVVLALAALGLLVVHPSVVFVAVLAAAVVIAAVLPTAAGRSWLRARLPALAAAGGLGLLVTLPWLLAGVTLGSQVAAFPLVQTPATVADVMYRIARFAYGPGFDIAYGESSSASWDLFHTSFSVLFWVGFLGCLSVRRLRPLAVLWTAFAALFVVWAAGGARAPVVTQIAAVFYNSANRLLDMSWVLAPAVAALGIGALLNLVARLAVPRIARLERVPSGLAAAVVVVVAAAAYTVAAGAGYAATNQRAIANRWSDPIAIRVSPRDREAFAYLDSVRDDVGRVVNSANDGSTYLYVYTGLPVVNVYPVGNRETQYGIYLMQHLNELDDSPQVRCLVRRWDLTHVFVSQSAPQILSVGAPDEWTGEEQFRYAPGFADLDRVTSLTEVFDNGEAQVYEIDPEVARTADLAACPDAPSEAPGAGASPR